MIVHSNGTYGHVAVVDSIQDGTLYAVDQNRSGSGWETYSWNASTHTAAMGAVTISGFVHAEGNTGSTGTSTPSTPVIPQTASTEDAQYGGDFNGDGWGDTVILYRRSDNGVDIHILYGGVGTSMFTQSQTFVRSLLGTDGWDWTKIKVVAGKFNTDQYADLALLHKIADGGMDVHVLYGGAGTNMFSASYPPFIRHLYGATEGWSWDVVKVVSGNFNGDAWDDILIAHHLTTGGVDIHLLYGQNGSNMFSSAYPSFTRRLPVGDGWLWNNMKLAAGDSNGDGYADLSIFYYRASDDGIDIHILYGGGGGYTFVNTVTFVRSLNGNGWDWSKVKLVAGDFNGNSPVDVALLHQLSDGGFDVHIVYGDYAGAGNMFMNNVTFVRHMYGTSDWNWSQLKLTSGDFNFDGVTHWGDITMLHQIPDGGMDVHILYGGAGTNMFTNGTTFVRRLSGASGWDWTKVKVG
jgi:hypothetical protein